MPLDDISPFVKIHNIMFVSLIPKHALAPDLEDETLQLEEPLSQV
jgi:hypothetical protein